ncbi:MAG: hypothetical protein E7Z84_05695 [Methanosphaera stadtmanae]|nr:hypothetical protein [Methanosphaera stadtmanae]
MITKYLSNIPISIGAIVLAIAAIGNLVSSLLPFTREISLLIGLPLVLITISKLIVMPGTLKNDLNNPILASVIAAFSMSFMLWSMFLIPYLGINICIILWYLAIILHLIFVINYIIKFIWKLNVSDYTAGSFVVFAGIQMIGITAPAFQQELLGTIAFWISFTFVCFVFIIVTYRYLTIKVPKQLQPIIGVYGAPISLCLVGYLSSVRPFNPIFAIGMFLLTKSLYIMILIKFVEYRHYPFYPTYTGYTFPLAINATTTYQMITHIVTNPTIKTLMSYELYIEIIIGVCIIFFVLYNFMINIFIRNWQDKDKN